MYYVVKMSDTRVTEVEEKIRDYFTNIDNIFTHREGIIDVAFKEIPKHSREKERFDEFISDLFQNNRYNLVKTINYGRESEKVKKLVFAPTKIE